MNSIELLENDRLTKQDDIDSFKTLKERNILGQYATPPSLAKEIAIYASSLINVNKVNFLEPAIGSGSFFSAILKTFGVKKINTAKGFEIDKGYAGIAISNWSRYGLDVKLQDFTLAQPKQNERYNLLITNPPYSRHHHLDITHKHKLKEIIRSITGFNVSGLTSLYCYFIYCAHQWLDIDGISIWLVPSDFMDINYGIMLKKYLTENVKLIRIHRFNPEDLQFADALVSSCIIVFQNKKPDKDTSVMFTSGGSLMVPHKTQTISLDQLSPTRKWSHFSNNISFIVRKDNDILLSDIFDIRRGIATGDNDYFILTEDVVSSLNIRPTYLTPLLPSPRYLKCEIVNGDHSGYPILKQRLFIINTNESLDAIKIDCPGLYNYLISGEAKNINNKYMPSRMHPWYKQEKRQPALYLCTYMGRSSANKEAFRFVWNKSKAIATNTYLMLYPKEQLNKYIVDDLKKQEIIFNELNKLVHRELKSECRTYGGGLHKIEPKELGNVRANHLLKSIDLKWSGKETQLTIC